MGDGVDGRVSALQEFGKNVATTVASIGPPATSRPALQYAPPPMPVDTLQGVADGFKTELQNAGAHAEAWDGQFRSGVNFYADFATLLGTRIDDVDKTHGDAVKGLFDQIAGQVPRRGG
jgi:hypothetical protein